MKNMVVAISLILLAEAACAEETLVRVSWVERKAEGKPTAGEVVLQDGVELLKVTNPTGKPLSAKILTFESPKITNPTYAVTGLIGYEGVEGKGYLEMWSVFPDGNRYFSRTLAPQGPMGYLKGSSEPRPFVLPFFAGETNMCPQKLVLNVVLPDRGTVYLSPLRLVQYASGEDPLAVAGVWWGERTGGWIGAIMGATLGLIGTLIGVLTAKGRARGFVLGIMKFTVVAGVGSLALGVIALIKSQPYAVWYPLLLVGLLCTLVMVSLLSTVRRRYEELELRRMSAQDVS